MDYNQPDSDNQTQLLKVWRIQPGKCKRISYFFTFIRLRLGFSALQNRRLT